MGELFAVIFNEYGTFEIVAPASGRILQIRREEEDTVLSENVWATAVGAQGKVCGCKTGGSMGRRDL